jgi:hypothetical protein
MHKMLDDFIAERAQAFAEKRAAVMTVEGGTIIADLQSGETRDDRFHADADDAVVGDAYRRTARIVSRTLPALTRWNVRNASPKRPTISTTR